MGSQNHGKRLQRDRALAVYLKEDKDSGRLALVRPVRDKDIGGYWIIRRWFSNGNRRILHRILLKDAIKLVDRFMAGEEV